MKNKSGDYAYWFYIVLMLTFGVAQIIHMICHSTQGLSTSTFLLSGVFILLKLKLAYNAHGAAPNKETYQTLGIYWLGVALYMGIMTILIAKSHNIWDPLDTLTMVLTTITTFATIMWAKSRNIGFGNPVIDGVCTLIVKVVPSTIMAWKVWKEGGGGLSTGLVIVYHILITLEILQVLRTAIATRWDGNTKALLIATIGNEISWVLVTIAWLAH